MSDPRIRPAPRRPVRLLPWLVALMLGGCHQDPFQRPGTWAPTGANDANLRAMVAQPADLVTGHGTETGLAAEAAPPVARLLSGRRLPLPAESASGVSEAAPTAASPGAESGQGNGGQ
jgi:hypothetical protein